VILPCPREITGGPTSSKYRHRAVIARATQTGDTARATSARRDLAAENIAEYVKRIVSAAPPLTAAQRDRVAALLRGGR